MTNFKRIQSMSVEELAAWLDEHGQFDGSPWNNWFNGRYCENCEPIELKYEDSKQKLGITPFYDETLECGYCECHDHCKFFPNIKGIPSNKEVLEMWLIEEVGNENV